MKVLAFTPDASLLLQPLANEIERDLDVVIEPSIPAGLERLDKASWSLVFVDTILGDRVVPVAEQIALAGHRVVLLTRSLSVQLVIDALRRGVWDLLRLPICPAELHDVIARTRAASRQAATPALLDNNLVSSVTLIGECPQLTTAAGLGLRATNSSVPVLIVGESGTGKELLARVLHSRSCRRDGPFVAVDCAATSESELFGDETGRSGGSAAQPTGLIGLARGGTLFLDEIADLPLSLQSKMLRAIEERRPARPDAQNGAPADVRLVAATKHALGDQVAAGRLRRDLYYQLSLLVLHVPPLRDRGDDIRLLAEHFIRRCGEEHGWQTKRIADDTLSLLRQYPWPGNVGELFNVVGQALIAGEGPAILPVHLPAKVRDYSPSTPPGGVERRMGRDRRASDRRSRSKPLPPLQTLEHDHILRALTLTSGQIGRAADLLGIHRNTLRRKLREIQPAVELQTCEPRSERPQPDPVRL